MKGNIDAQETPALWGSTDTAPALEIYANEQFDTSDGKMVLPGSPELGDFRHRVVGSVVDAVATFPIVQGIYSTEDSLTNQLATYSAFIRVNGRPLIPWLERFQIPPLLQGVESWSWTRLRIHKEGVRARRDNNTYTATQTDQAIDAAILQGTGLLRDTGIATLINGEALVESEKAQTGSRIVSFSMDPNVTGVLIAPIVDIVPGESFMIRSTNPGDNGQVSWFVVN